MVIGRSQPLAVGVVTNLSIISVIFDPIPFLDLMVVDQLPEMYSKEWTFLISVGVERQHGDPGCCLKTDTSDFRRNAGAPVWQKKHSVTQNVPPCFQSDTLRVHTRRLSQLHGVASLTHLGRRAADADVCEAKTQPTVQTGPSQTWVIFFLHWFSVRKFLKHKVTRQSRRRLSPLRAEL